MDSRQQFEKRYPVPFNADWSDEYQRYIWNKKDNSLTAAIEHSKLWEAWQASRESLVVELPTVHRDVTFDDESIDLMWPDDVIKAIHSAGIRTK